MAVAAMRFCGATRCARAVHPTAVSSHAPVAILVFHYALPADLVQAEVSFIHVAIAESLDAQACINR